MPPSSTDIIQSDPLALYVHWPFCVSKCPYCDFNSHVRASIDTEAWRAALLTDLRHEAAVTSGRKVSSVFFGGGTPSLMPPHIAADLLNEAEKLWGFTDNVEITLEANPNSAEAARFADLSAAGVNRISLGIQSLDDEALHFLGRAHSAKEGLDALSIAQRLFNRVSFDLIYARPNQSESDWEQELSRALAFETSHLSLYQLTIEPGTRFATLVAKGELVPADGDHGATLYELTQAMTQAAGIPAYEISNHARLDQESRHNLVYWRYGDYVGIGPGAHGRRHGVATLRHKKPENWMSAIDRNANGLQTEEKLNPDDQAREALLMGLRLHEGVDLAHIAERSGVPTAALINEDAVEKVARLGFIDRTGDHLRIPPAGMLLLDAILPEIVAI